MEGQVKKLIEGYLKNEKSKAERAYSLVVEILIKECFFPAPIQTIDKGLDDTEIIGNGVIEEEIEKSPARYLWKRYLWKRSLLFRFGVLYRAALEVAHFRQKKSTSVLETEEKEFFTLRLMAEIPMIDADKFVEAAKNRREILKRICGEKGIKSFEMPVQKVYILIKELNYSQMEDLINNLADFIEGLQEWYHTDPSR